MTTSLPPGGLVELVAELRNGPPCEMDAHWLIDVTMAEELCDRAADALEALALQVEEMRKALEGLKSAGHSVLSAMDDWNAENGTYLGGSAFFELGRAISNADAILSKGDPA